MSAFQYPLRSQLASFDFYNWLVLAVEHGATEIVFDTDKPKLKNWPEPVIRKRFESIVAPGPALIGLPSRIGIDGWPFDEVRFTGGRYMSGLVKWVQRGGSFQRLRSVLPPGKARYTVTLRNDMRIRARNSNKAAWQQFAQDIGAVVIEDYEDVPISLHERVALYAGAEMNFGVTTGPLHLCALSDYPYMIFCGMAVGAMENCGVMRGTNYPWSSGPEQRLVWEMDDIDSIRKAWKGA